MRKERKEFEEGGGISEDGVSQPHNYGWSSSTCSMAAQVAS